MGIQGTEVAKESSDIIILDDNFASVVKVSKQIFWFKWACCKICCMYLYVCLYYRGLFLGWGWRDWIIHVISIRTTLCFCFLL